MSGHDARALERALFELIAQEAQRLGITLGDEAIELQLRLPHRAEELSGRELRAAIHRVIAERASLENAFHRGAVHCFRCRRADCEHARPPRPTAVFAGFGPSGAPDWHDLLQHLIELGDARSEGLAEGRPVACLELGRELKKRQLSVFGRSERTYVLLGQVAFGYVDDRAGGRFAITIQVADCRRGRAESRLELNPIARLASDQPISTWLETHPETLLAQALGRARQRVRELDDERARKPQAPSPLARVPQLLRGLAAELEHPRGWRRTEHAQLRRRHDRPVPAALRDAREAPDEALFVDERTDAVIVVGPRGRAHAFNRDGRHVTSLALGDGELARRQERRRWRPAGSEEIAAFRKAVDRPAAG